MNLAHLLARTARVFPQRNAVTLAERELWSYGELSRRAAAIAGSLRGVHGLQAGDRVALCMANCPQYLELLYGVWHAGLVAVPINHKLHPREVAFIVDNSAASLLVVAGDPGGPDGDRAFCADGRGGPRVLSIDSREYRQLADGETIDVVARAPDDQIGRAHV